MNKLSLKNAKETEFFFKLMQSKAVISISAEFIHNLQCTIEFQIGLPIKVRRWEFPDAAVLELVNDKKRK